MLHILKGWGVYLSWQVNICMKLLYHEKHNDYLSCFYIDILNYLFIEILFIVIGDELKTGDVLRNYYSIERNILWL